MTSSSVCTDTAHSTSLVCQLIEVGKRFSGGSYGVSSAHNTESLALFYIRGIARLGDRTHTPRDPQTLTAIGQ
jgi:hypothetical protein